MSLAMLDDKRWIYEVPCINKSTAARCVVTIELTATERKLCLRELARNPEGPGGDSGCLANRFCLDHADKVSPPGFTPVTEGIRRIRRLVLQ
jgi:hypothetical protein